MACRFAAILGLLLVSLMPAPASAQFRREQKPVAEPTVDPLLVALFMSHAPQIQGAAPAFAEFSPDSQTLYVASRIGPVPRSPIARKRPSASRITAGVVESVRNDVDRVELFPTRSREYPSDRPARAISVFRVQDGELLRQYVCDPPDATEEEVLSMDISPDGKFLAAVGTLGRGLYIFDAATDALHSYCNMLDERNTVDLARAAFVMVGDTLQVLTEAPTKDCLYLHSVPDGKIVDTIDLSDDKFDYQSGLTATPDGKLFAVGMTVWDATRAELLSYQRHSESWRGLLAPSGKEVFFRDPAQLLRWNRTEDKPRKAFEVPSRKSITAVAVSPDERWLALAREPESSANEVTIDVFDCGTERHVRGLAGHVADIYGLAFSPDGKLLASVSRDGSTRLWNVADLK